MKLLLSNCNNLTFYICEAKELNKAATFLLEQRYSRDWNDCDEVFVDLEAAGYYVSWSWDDEDVYANENGYIVVDNLVDFKYMERDIQVK